MAFHALGITPLTPAKKPTAFPLSPNVVFHALPAPFCLLRQKQNSTTLHLTTMLNIQYINTTAFNTENRLFPHNFTPTGKYRSYGELSV
jgi:hypothetical protein